MHSFSQESYRSKHLLGVGSLSIVCFPAIRRESWAHVVLLLGVGLGFDHKETTETHSVISRSQNVCGSRVK
jgi:hypothetical protein